MTSKINPVCQITELFQDDRSECNEVEEEITSRTGDRQKHNDGVEDSAEHRLPGDKMVQRVLMKLQTQNPKI